MFLEPNSRPAKDKTIVATNQIIIKAFHETIRQIEVG
jgi:hypothetical protein